MPHLVDEEEQDEADGKRPAESQAVGGDRDQHRPERGQGLDLDQGQEEELGLARQDRERDQGSAELLQPRLLALPVQILGRRRFGRDQRLGR